MINSGKFAVLIVTHNHGEYIDALLQSLEMHHYKNVYICDAASTDNTLTSLDASSFNILSKSRIEGFSKNNNDLIREFNIHPNYIILLNPDTYFDTDIAGQLVKFMDEHPKAAIAAPKVLFPDGSIQVSWKRFPNLLRVITKRLGGSGDKHSYDGRTQEIDWAIGAALIVRTKYMLKDGKLLDERYRLYCEDSDLCMSAHQKGHEVWGKDDTIVYHHLHEISAKKTFGLYNLINIQSLIKFIFKWNIRYMGYLLNIK